MEKSAKMPSKTILPEFQELLIQKKPVVENKVSFYALWVSKFLAFLNRRENKETNNLVSPRICL